MRIVCQQTILMKYQALLVIFEKAAKFEIVVCCKLKVALYGLMPDNQITVFAPKGHRQSSFLSVMYMHLEILSFWMIILLVLNWCYMYAPGSTFFQSYWNVFLSSSLVDQVLSRG